jgi:hypothetical protein
MRPWPEKINGYEVWASICDAVPVEHYDAVALWGEDVVSCDPQEWHGRTIEENALWLLCRLYVYWRLDT